MSESNPQNPNVDRALREIAKFQFVLDEGRKGHHLLFDQDLIRKTFAHGQDELARMFQARIAEINAALNHTFQFSTFEEKRDFIRTLPEEIQQSLIFGYFQLIDGDQQRAPDRAIH